MRKSVTLRLTVIAMLTAMCVALNALSITITNTFKISFVIIPCMIAGLWMGPIDGFAVGVLGDLIGFLIHPDGAFMPTITLATGLMGLIPGLIRRLPVKDISKIIIASVLCLIICTAGINTVTLWVVYAFNKKTFWVYLWARLPFQAINSLVNCVLTCALYPLLVKAMGKAGFDMNGGFKEEKAEEEDKSDESIAGLNCGVDNVDFKQGDKAI